MTEESKTSSIVIDDGSIEVPIVNKTGREIGKFYFRPTDVGIVARYNELADSFSEITKPIENVSVNADGTVNEFNENDMAAMHEAEQRLYAACDKLFGGNMAEAFFGKMHPFSPIGGKFYCENVLSAVGKYIEKQFSIEVKRINARVDKYTHGYAARTGKHKDGRK